VSFCEKRQIEKHFAYPNARQQVAHFFHLVKPNDVDRSAMWDCKNITGTRSLHSVTSISPRDVTLLKLRDLACFYPKCMDDNPYFCENGMHVEPWNMHTLEPINLTHVNFNFNIFVFELALTTLQL
jgi:hypothetical protein